MAGKSGNLIKTFLAHLEADKKKSALLCLLLIVFVIVLSRMLMDEEAAVPAESAADLVVSTPASQPNTDLTRPVPVPPVVDTAAGVQRAWGAGESATRRTGPHGSEKHVSVDGMPRVLVRDLFSTKAWDRFVPDLPVVSLGPKPRSQAQGPDLFERLRALLTERCEARQAAVEQVETDLAGLELKSTLVAARPAAFISGRIVHQGDVIKGFQILRIRHREVDVRKNGIDRTLSIP